MTQLLKRWTRLLAPILLAIGLLLSPPASQSVSAQPQPAPEEQAAGQDKGRPLDGYLGTLCLVMLALFLVGKSARR
jgi:hypothetical protein